MNTLRQQIDEAILTQLQQAVAGGAHRRYVGRYTEALETWLRSSLRSYVLLTNSGTSALELALRAVGVVPGDEVILSGYDYPGNFWAIEQLGCVPVLVDIQGNSTRIDFNQLQQARSERTRACVVSHLHGQLQEIVQLREWADRNQIILVEDACQSLGAQLDGKAIGSIGHLGILSFSGSKVISASRGGALLTQDDKLYQKAKIASGAGSGAFGLSELAAAIVTAQLPFLQSINDRCASYFDSLQQLIENNPQTNAQLKFLVDTRLTPKNNHQPALYQAGWVCKSSQQCTAVIQRLTQMDVPAGAGFLGFHRRSQRRCRPIGDLVNTASLVDRLLVIHHSVAIDERISSQQLAAEITEALL
jgi:dTDP-4-amino-4,6-dideoxygalactose transaminase